MSSRGTSEIAAGRLYDGPLRRAIAAVVARLDSEMRRNAPFLADRALAWLRSFSPTEQIEESITHPRSFPLILLPCWLERSLGDDGAGTLQSDLIYSSLNGYFFIRLLDNVMDGEATVEQRLLPAAGFFHAHFQRPYHEHFEPGHPFWSFFFETWTQAAEATTRDAFLETVEESDFLAVSGRKFLAAKIPIAAVCFRYQRRDLLAEWCGFLDRLGCWHQMVNDLFDWLKDEHLGHNTFILCEARRRRQPGEAVAGWMAREGFVWAIARLNRWMSDLQSWAPRLGCPQVEPYLRFRSSVLADQARQAESGLRAVRRLSSAFR